MSKQRFLTIATSLLLALLLIACGQQEPPTLPPTPTAEAEETAASEEDTAEPITQPALTVLADGEIKAGRPLLALSFEANGKLLTLNVQPGDQVQEGDVIAVLDDKALQEALTTAELQLTSTQYNLAKAEAELENLLTWEPDESAIAIAEANIASAEASLSNAQSQDAAAGTSLTAASIEVEQAERALAEAQEKYDNAFSPGREWEVFYDEPICDRGEIEPCQGITWAERIANDRDAATAQLQGAQDRLEIARANYAVEASRVNRNSAVSAEASLTNAQQELIRAQKGPTEAEIAAAQLNVEQAEIALEQDQFNVQKAQDALDQATLVAPWSGTIASVDVATGATINAGLTIVTLLDTEQLEFHTTNLSERDLAQISSGQAALVTLKTYPDDVFEGSVSRIGVQATGTVGDAAVFPVIIRLENPEALILPGMTGRVEILREE